jgi:pimeloyl-ACP methyl ester carboxylesterase
MDKRKCSAGANLGRDGRRQIGAQYQITPADLEAIRVPSLIVRGSETHPMFHAISATLAATIPHAQLLELQGSGHVTYAEMPEEIATAVELFASSSVFSTQRFETACRKPAW